MLPAASPCAVIVVLIVVCAFLRERVVTVLSETGSSRTLAPMWTQGSRGSNRRVARVVGWSAPIAGQPDDLNRTAAYRAFDPVAGRSGVAVDVMSKHPPMPAIEARRLVVRSDSLLIHRIGRVLTTIIVVLCNTCRGYCRRGRSRGRHAGEGSRSSLMGCTAVRTDLAGTRSRRDAGTGTPRSQGPLGATRFSPAPIPPNCA